MNFSKQFDRQCRPRGVTLIELLVVVAIMSVLTAIMIPRLRVVNKDRNIREAARQVASSLAKVNTRAIDEGVSGVIIERNSNFVDDKGDADTSNDVWYAGTRMYTMRKLPPYIGDDSGDEATVAVAAGVMTAMIDTPLEHSFAQPLIRPGDQIRLNNNSVIYEILAVDPPMTGQINLTLSLGLNAGFGAVRPALAAGDYPYVIYRQPRKLESSRVDLPDGYYIDLRLSGPLVPTPATPPVAPDWERGSVFDIASLAPTIQRSYNGDIRLALDQNGVINRWGAFDAAETLVASGVPQDAFYFYVTHYDPDVTGPNLLDEAAMWVTMDRSTGSVNVAYNAPPPATLTTAFERIKYARGFGKTRRSANQ